MQEGERAKTITIAIVGRALERKPLKKKQRTGTKKDAQIRIKSDNFTRSRWEKSNIAIAYFGGSNNIFANVLSIILFVTWKKSYEPINKKRYIMKIIAIPYLEEQ